MTQLQKIKPGPVTAEGKRRSSMNARTHGLYSRSLLGSESPQHFKSLVASMMEDWAVQCSTGELLVNQLAALVFRQSRFESARIAISESAFTEHRDIKEFCEAAGIGFDRKPCTQSRAVGARDSITPDECGGKAGAFFQNDFYVGDLHA